MSKQKFGRLDVLLRVQSGRLWVSDSCVLIALQRRQAFRRLRGLKQDGPANSFGVGYGQDDIADRAVRAAFLAEYRGQRT
jgi:hypothetical protein